MSPTRPPYRLTDFLLASLGAITVVGLPALAIGELFGAGADSWWWDAAAVACLVAFFALAGWLHANRPDREPRSPSRVYFLD